MNLTDYRTNGMQIRIIKPGLLTTIQDMGRCLYLQQGVPLSGAMDTLAMRIANKAVGNYDNAAVIEFTYAGAELLAQTDLLIACCGDGAILASANKVIPAARPVFIPKGNILTLRNNPAGSHAYLAVAGGWDVPEVLGSRSTYITAGIGGLLGRALLASDVLVSCPHISQVSQNMLNSLTGDALNYPGWNLNTRHLLPIDKKVIRIVPGHEFTWFDAESLTGFLSKPYTLGLNSNRMGYLLTGQIINRVIKDEPLSTAVTPGTIQVTGDGSMILLMADCQTTGGYPRIGQVAAVDMPLCSQLKPGDTIYFKEISRREAEQLYLEREQQLSKLTTAVQHRVL